MHCMRNSIWRESRTQCQREISQTAALTHAGWPCRATRATPLAARSTSPERLSCATCVCATMTGRAAGRASCRSTRAGQLAASRPSTASASTRAAIEFSPMSSRQRSTTSRSKAAVGAGWGWASASRPPIYTTRCALPRRRMQRSRRTWLRTRSLCLLAATSRTRGRRVYGS